MVSRMSFATEACAGIVDTVLSSLTELKSCGVSHSVIAVHKVLINGASSNYNWEEYRGRVAKHR